MKKKKLIAKCLYMVIRLLWDDVNVDTKREIGNLFTAIAVLEEK